MVKILIVNQVFFLFLLCHAVCSIPVSSTSVCLHFRYNRNLGSYPNNVHFFIRGYSHTNEGRMMPRDCRRWRIRQWLENTLQTLVFWTQSPWRARSRSPFRQCLSIHFKYMFFKCWIYYQRIQELLKLEKIITNAMKSSIRGKWLSRHQMRKEET